MPQTRVDTLRKHRRLHKRRRRILNSLERGSQRPRLVVYRSNRHIYAQLVDGMRGNTLTGCSSQSPGLKDKITAAKSPVEKAKLVGEHIAALAKEKGITQVTFDRNGCKYHGRVKSLAEGARAGGLQF